MAEGRDGVVEKGVKDLEEEITCAICHEHYTEPKVLPCCHYYCKQCLHQLTLRKGADKPFSCPECRKDTTLPEGGLDNLPTAFFVNRMKEVHSKLELAHGKVEAKCEMCSEDKAEAFCRQCAKFMCADCAKSHLKMKKVYPGHKVSTLDELREGGAEDIVVIKEPSFHSCGVHEQPMTIYCSDCKSLICRDCTIKLHRDHDHEFVKVAAPHIKQKLLQQLDPLRESCSNMLCAVDGVHTTISEVEDQGKSVTKQIKSSFAELRNIIDYREQELLTETATKVEQKCKHLSEQGKGLSIACAAVESVIDYTEHCVEHSADDEIMCMHTEIQSRINREIEEQQKEWRDLEPVEEVDLGVEVNCAEDLKQLCQTKAKITRLPIDAVKSTVIGEGAGSAEVNKASQYHFQLFPKLSNGRPPKRACVVACSLKSLADDTITQCQVELTKGNKYRTQYTPTFRGRHELIVTVNGQKVAGFPLFVSIHPTLLGKPVRVITGVRTPRDVAVSATGNIIVTEQSWKGVVFDKSGKKLRTLSTSKFSIRNPRGVAVDNTDGCVYVSDWGKKIVKLSPDFEQVGELTGQEGAVYRCMAVVGDEVMVTEYSKNVVMVYTKDLEYVRQFGSHGDGPGQFKNIFGVSSGETGNLYVGDYGRGCVHVFSNGGEFLYSFGQGGDGVKLRSPVGVCVVGHLYSFGQGGDGVKLRSPVGVCVVGQYVYVVSIAGNCVSVFTTEGEYVTSFGKCGSGEGDFSYPWGVCVDKDGYVYVCDSFNKRVQML